MDHRQLFGFAAIILSSAVFIHTLKSANALPQGPNVSLGSNPIQSWAGSINNNGWHTIDSFQNDFVITDLSISGNNYCTFILYSSQNNYYTTSGAIATAHFYQYNGSGDSFYSEKFVSGMKIPAGTTLSAYVNRNGYCHYNLSGYHTH